MRDRLAIVLLFLSVVVVYGNALGDGFTLDDHLYILTNPQVTRPTLPTLFSAHSFSNVFRPLSFATFALNWWWRGAHPFTYHLLNLLLHAGVVILLYFVLQTALGAARETKMTALVAAWLFAVHPLHTEAVTSIVGRSELLAAGFLLSAWLLHLRDRPIGALLCLLMALLSKESAIVFLGLVLVGDYARAAWKPLVRYAGIVVLTLLYLGALWRVEGARFGRKVIPPLDNPLGAIPTGWRILNALGVAWKYVGLQIYPAKLSCDYSFNQIPISFDWRQTLPAALASVVVVGVWLWAVRRRHAGGVLAGGIYFAAFATTSNILLPTGTIMGERLAYLPSAGFCLLAAMGWSWLEKRQRTVALGVLGVVLLALGTRTIRRNLDWRDNPTLFAAAVQAAPDSAKAHTNLAIAYVDADKLDLARKEIQEALRIKPDYAGALELAGLLDCWTGNYEACGPKLEKAFSMTSRDDPEYDYRAVNLAAFWMQTGYRERALEFLNQQITESPSYARSWSNRAVIRYQRGDPAAARADAERALQLDPDNTQAQNLLRLLGK